MTPTCPKPVKGKSADWLEATVRLAKKSATLITSKAEESLTETGMQIEIIPL